MYHTHDNVDGDVSDRDDHGFMVMGGAVDALAKTFITLGKKALMKLQMENGFQKK